MLANVTDRRIMYSSTNETEQIKMTKLHAGFYSYKGFSVASNGKVWRALGNGKNKGVEIFAKTKKEAYKLIDEAA